MNDVKEIREALATSGCYMAEEYGDEHNDPECPPCIIDAAARAYVELVESGALIIQRDKDGKWPYSARRAFMESMVATRDVDGWLTPRGMDNALDALAAVVPVEANGE